MTIAYPFRSSLSVLCVSMAGACFSGTKSGPDAPVDVNSATDASVVSPPDSPGFDSGREAEGEASQPIQLTVSPASFDLGVLAVGEVVQEGLVVTAAQDISDLTVSIVGQDLTLDEDSTCGNTLYAGGQCVVVFRFRAAALGARSDSIVIATGGQSTVVLVTAQVRTTSGLTIIPTGARFPLVCGGQSTSPQTFQIPNLGDANLGPLTVAIQGSDFAATTTGCDLIPPGASCTIAVVFAPARSGLVAVGTLTVTGPAPDFPTAIATLAGGIGTGPPRLLLSPTSRDLGLVVVGMTGSPFLFTLTNLGCPDLGTLGPFTVTLPSADFVITNDTCRTSVLASGQDCTVSVALRPTSVGAKSAALSVTADPFATTAVLIGTGVDSATDASIVGPLDGASLDTSIVDPVDTAGLDAGSEFAGEAGPAG